MVTSQSSVEPSVLANPHQDFSIRRPLLQQQLQQQPQQQQQHRAALENLKTLQACHVRCLLDSETFTKNFNYVRVWSGQHQNSGRSGRHGESVPLAVRDSEK